ncbi:MAG: hypothetical protein HYT12_00255 [Candidatus Liptonbacteria bacterium]|nr:hypothetical protein [Candidatus Liptonbacteria bacterium]
MITEELSRLFKERLSKNARYAEALDLVRKNSEGKIWLMGGTVYKGLINILYGFDYTSKDFDFIVEKEITPFKYNGWDLRGSRFGSPKFIKNDLIVDFVSINNIYAIKTRNLPGIIENYLKTVPLSIHSVVFDIQDEKLIGDIGINSILSKTIFIQNKEHYEICRLMYADKHDLEKNAQLFGFKIIE